MKYSELTDLQKKHRKYEISKDVIIPLLSVEELNIYLNGISGNAPFKDWLVFYSMNDKIDELVMSDGIEIIGQEFVTPQRLTGKYLDDYMTPIVNHANGKTYDSRSTYYKDLKASGHIVMEAGMDKPRETRGDFDVSKDLKRAAQQHGLI